MADKNVEVKLKGVRLAFFHGFKPQERRDDKTKELTGYNFSVNALIEKNTPEGKAQIELVKAAMREARAATWGDTPPRIGAEKMCFRDGEPVDPDTGKPAALYDGYEGCMFLSANRGVTVEEWKNERKNPVQLLGPRKTDKDPATGKPRFPRLKESDGMLYSGCYADVIVRIYGYKNSDYPARINASLEAVKFVRHGKAFGGKPLDADSAFDEEEGEEDDFEPGASSSKPASGADEDDLLG